MTHRHLTLSALAVLLLAGQLHAATFSVTRTNDPLPDGCAPTDCSLREAVLDANATPELDIIQIPAGNYEAFASSGGSLPVESPVRIQGAGVDETTVNMDTGGLFIFFRDTAAGSIVSDLTLSGDAVTVDSGSRVTFTGCRVENAFSLGFDNSGESVFEDCTFENIGGFIAIIRNRASGQLTLRRTTVDGSGAFGPSLLNNGSAVLENCTFNEGTLFTSTIQNTGNLSVRNCTLALPETPDGFPGVVVGLANNGTAELANSIFRGACAGTLLDLGGNLEGPADTCGFIDTSSQFDVADLGLGGLSQNGGPTRTRALLDGSPALDAAVPDTCPETDQRGELRRRLCDSGAYEAETAGGCSSVGARGQNNGPLFFLLLATMLGRAWRERD